MDEQKDTWIAREKQGVTTSYEIGTPDIHYPDVVVEITPTARGYEVSVDRVHVSQEYDKQADAYDYVVKYENLHSGDAKSISEVSDVVFGRHGIDMPKDLTEQLIKHQGELQREIQRKPEFEAAGNSYYVESTRAGEWASVTPREGGFDVAVGRDDLRDHWDGRRGEYTQAPEDITLHRSHEATVDDVQQAVEPFGIKLPESLNKELEARQSDQREITDQLRYEWTKKFGRDPEEQFAEERAKERDGTAGPIGYTQEEYERQTDWAIERSGNRMSGLPEESWADYSKRTAPSGQLEQHDTEDKSYSYSRGR